MSNEVKMFARVEVPFGPIHCKIIHAFQELREFGEDDDTLGKLNILARELGIPADVDIKTVTIVQKEIGPGSFSG
ncbi:hypothetical protein KBD75_02365 [Candidatus Woesebacteria bacterium]|nr:hypothetical protein [Candidatus Woesebacteria bacterium]